jgi:hypothetical protein
MGVKGIKTTRQELSVKGDIYMYICLYVYMFIMYIYVCIDILYTYVNTCNFICT